VTRFALLLVLMVVAARFFWRLVETVLKGAMGPAPQGGRRSPGPPAAVKMQPCPVCGTYVVPGKALSAVSGGAPVYFCSEKCRTEFQSR
jgi:YHS domain-containing protein